MALVALIATPRASGNAEKPLLFPQSPYVEDIAVLKAPYKPYEPPSEVLVAKTIIEPRVESEGVMARIEWCESRGIATAENPRSTAKGLYQILDGTWENFECTGDPLNPVDNRACALKIADDGLHHWNASKNCWNS